MLTSLKISQSEFISRIALSLHTIYVPVLEFPSNWKFKVIHVQYDSFPFQIMEDDSTMPPAK